MKLIDPPGPKGVPLFGVALQFRKDPLKLLMEVVKSYGDIAQLPLFKIPLTPMEPKNRFYLINRPNLVRQICVTKTEKYRTHKQLVEKLKATLELDDGELLTSTGDAWLKRKRLLQPSFKASSTMGLTDKVAAATSAMTARWQGLSDNSVIDLNVEMTHCITNLFAALFLSLDLDREDESFSQNWHNMLDGLSRKMAMPFHFLLKIPTKANREFAASWQLVQKRIYEVIEDHQRNSDHYNDFLMTWISAASKSKESNLDSKDFRDQVMLMLLAGRKNISNALVWSIDLLSKHPEVFNKLRAEIDSKVSGEIPNVEELKNLTYLEMVQQEILRLYPTAWLTARLCLEDDDIGGYRIPKGATVFMSPYAIHRHPNYWDEPDVFKPDRFSEANAKNIKTDVYLPFGLGQRTCIGNFLSKHVIHIVLAIVAKHFSFEAIPGRETKIKATSSLHPTGKLPVILKKRQGGGTMT